MKKKICHISTVHSENDNEYFINNVEVLARRDMMYH